METTLLFAALGALTAWVLLFLAIWHWGPGRARRRVRCPGTNVAARLTVLYTEPSFGAIEASDVVRCSLFPEATVSCGKQCLARF